MNKASGGAFWQTPLDELERQLGASSNGLNSTEAAARLLRHGANTLDSRQKYSFLLKVLSRFRNPLVLILLVAAVISGFTGDVASLVIISTMVLLSVLLDSVQEYRAEQAAEQLKVSVALKEQVLRDGREITIRADQLVLGDVVLLAAGDMVPADGRLLEARDFFVNEGLLTGESYPTEKHVAAEGTANVDVAQAANAAFMGTSVVSGSAKLLLCATGNATQLGEISATLRHTPPPAALERGVYEFGILIVRLTVLLVLFVLLVNTFFHRPLLESFLFALALAVGLTPELLPMIVSVTLARGAMRMAKQKVIVKRLAAIHDLGSMDVLCTDKTGTLTEAKIALIRHITLSGADSERVLELAWLNSHFESGLRSPLDAAILEHASSIPAGWTKIDEVPFDFERRRVSVLLEHGGRRILVIKGAPEDVLKLSSRYELLGENDTQPFDAAALARANTQFQTLCEEGFRVLGIAWREEPASQTHVVVSDEHDFVFAGYAAFLDPPKASAGQAIAALER
ncbi:MAG: HAD-IC family P-type ATPase, partial [Pseudolabrys sp.]